MKVNQKVRPCSTERSARGENQPYLDRTFRKGEKDKKGNKFDWLSVNTIFFLFLTMFGEGGRNTAGVRFVRRNALFGRFCIDSGSVPSALFLPLLGNCIVLISFLGFIREY